MKSSTTDTTTLEPSSSVPAVETQEGSLPQASMPAIRTGRPRVVIVGAGFGGLNAARALAKADVDVLLLDHNNYHGFWPLLYQVATAGLEKEAIAYPVRAILRRQSNADFRMAHVESVDLDKRLVLTGTGSQPIPYDYLILAAGSADNYFGNNALARNTLGLKDLSDAETLRNHVLGAFERAAAEPDPETRRSLLTFVIIGGGPTGVEMAGALSELFRHVLRKDYPTLDIGQTSILLLEASDRILAAFPESLQRAAKRKLIRMGVQIKLGMAVESVEDGTVSLKDGSQIHAGTVVWAAGVRSSMLADTLGAEQARNARVKILPTLNLAQHPEVFVVGDMAYLEGYKGKDAYPMVAQVAIQQGKRAARNIISHIAGRSLASFRYFDYGTMATIGRSSAIFDAFGIHLSGRLAWLGWLFIHIIYLIGFRNRVIVLFNWAVNYFTYERGVRLITGGK